MNGTGAAQVPELLSFMQTSVVQSWLMGRGPPALLLSGSETSRHATVVNNPCSCECVWAVCGAPGHTPVWRVWGRLVWPSGGPTLLPAMHFPDQRIEPKDAFGDDDVPF